MPAEDGLGSVSVNNLSPGNPNVRSEVNKTMQLKLHESKEKFLLVFSKCVGLDFGHFQRRHKFM